MSRIFAYCRISTLDQTTENQRREIESAGFKIKPQQIIEEHISGSAATSERPGFNRLLARLKCGDQLIVTKLDRLGCNAMDIRKTVEQLTETGIRDIRFTARRLINRRINFRRIRLLLISCTGQNIRQQFINFCRDEACQGDIKISID